MNIIRHFTKQTTVFSWSLSLLNLNLVWPSLLTRACSYLFANSSKLLSGCVDHVIRDSKMVRTSAKSSLAMVSSHSRCIATSPVLYYWMAYRRVLKLSRAWRVAENRKYNWIQASLVNIKNHNQLDTIFKLCFPSRAIKSRPIFEQNCFRKGWTRCLLPLTLKPFCR